MIKKTTFRNAIFAALITLQPSVFAWGENSTDPSANSIPLGNALVRPQAIERTIRSIISNVLSADLNAARLNFVSEPIVEVIQLPEPKGDLKQIFEILGIKNTLAVEVQPLQTSFTLPQAALKIDIKSNRANTFEVKASWSISKITTKSDSIALKIPAGVFDRPFDIKSSPVQVGLKPGSAPVMIEVNLTTELTERGTKIHLKNFRTNLDSRSRPEFYVNLGQLSVNGKPFNLELVTNGQTLVASEAVIREQFKQIEPILMNTIYQKMVKILNQKIKEATARIEAEPAIRYETNTDDLLANIPVDQSVKKLVGGIGLDFFFSYLQGIKTKDLFSAQIASHICFDNQCLLSPVKPGPISAQDLDDVNKTDDVGIVVYESALQNLLHSEPFQARILNYYKASGSSPGVEIAPSGAKLFLDPKANSVAVVLNLEIDIKKTVKENSNFGERLKLRIGDLWELWFGTGKIVKIPVEIHFNLVGIVADETGKPNIVITTTLPFKEIGTHGDATYTAPKNCPLSQCPSNVDDLTGWIGPKFLGSVAAEVKKLVSPTIHIPVGHSVDVKGFKFQPKNLKITQGRGLIMTAKMKTPSGDKK